MASTFSEYATPASFSAYSYSDFYSMTFERATEVTYPKIAPPNSVDSWCFSKNIPTSAAGTVIIPADIIPNSVDLFPIFRDMEDAFGDGMRSVVLTMTLAESGSKKTYEYHFAKVSQQYIILVHLLRISISYGCSFLSTIMKLPFPLLASWSSDSHHLIFNLEVFLTN